VRKRTKAAQALAKSAGSFDTHAKQAIEEIEAIAEPTVDDMATHARINHYNVLENNAVTAHAGIANTGNANANAYNTNTNTYNAIIELADEYNMIMNVSDDALNDIARDAERFYMMPADAFTQPVLDNFAIVYTHRRDDARARFLDKLKSGVVNPTTNRIQLVSAILDNQAKSDTQNVHDTQVSKDLRSTMALLEDAPGGAINDAIDACGRLVNNNGCRVLEKIRDNPEHVMALDCTEADVLGKVWHRANHFGNSLQKKNIVKAIADSINDCVENGSMVCTSGRAARIIGSLATLDFDHRVGHAVTVDAYRSQMFNETQKELQQLIAEAGNSDGDLKIVADSYSDPTITAPAAAQAQFKQALTEKINANCNKYSTVMSPEQLENIRAECLICTEI